MIVSTHNTKCRAFLELLLFVGSVAISNEQVFAAPTTLYTYTVSVGDPGAALANAVAFDGQNIWVAVQERGTGWVKKIDRIGQVLSVTPVGNVPIEMAYDGKNVWVTDYLSSNVMAIDANGQVVGTVQLPPNAKPEGIMFDGRYIWVANNGEGANNVSKIDAIRMTLVASYAVGLNPDGVAFDGTNVWVTNSYSDNVVKLNRETGAIVRTYPTGDYPLSIIFDGTNMWIANGIDADDGSFVTGSVLKLRAYGGVSLGTFPVGSTVRGLGYDGTSIWVCNNKDNSVTRLRATDGARLGTYPVGSSPRSMAFDGTRMWIANSGDNTLTVVTPESHGVVSNLFVAGGRTNYQPVTVAPLTPTQTAVDAAFSGLSVDPKVTSAAMSAIVATLLSD